MLKRVATALWGNFENKAELRKFLFLAASFFMIIGTYWTMRPLKDSIFMSIVGSDYLPNAKILSLFLIVPIVILYSKLVDRFPRHQIFYGLFSLYGLIAIFFWWAFAHPTIGLANTETSPLRVIGWLWYVWVESFGSLFVAMFWAIVTDTTLPESAKRGFPIISLCGQLGNIFGPLMLRADRFGFATSAPIVGILGILMYATVLLFWVFMRTTPKELLTSYHGADESESSESEPGFFEGLRLLFSHWYLIGMFLLISVFEVIVTIFDNHFKQSVGELFSSELTRSAYLSDYAVWTGILSTACVFFGINNIQRRLGMTASLLVTPALVAVAVLLVKYDPLTLNIAFWVMVFSKGVNYALNQPTLKQLYIPTSRDTKYKSQAWIEMFGSRGSKAVSSGINKYRAAFIKKFGRADGLANFWTMSLLISFGLVGLWLFFALYVAKTYNKAIKEKKIVC